MRLLFSANHVEVLGKKQRLVTRLISSRNCCRCCHSGCRLPSSSQQLTLSKYEGIHADGRVRFAGVVARSIAPPSTCRTTAPSYEWKIFTCCEDDEATGLDGSLQDLQALSPMMRNRTRGTRQISTFGQFQLI